MRLKPTRPEKTFEDRLIPRKGKNWRTWAEKKIGKKDAGKWTVELVDDGGYAYETLAYEVVAGATATAP